VIASCLRILFLLFVSRDVREEVPENYDRGNGQSANCNAYAIVLSANVRQNQNKQGT
jgi:hypothetical protein